MKKNIIIFVLFISLFISVVYCYSEPLYISNYTSDFTLIYENFKTGVPVYKYFKVQINSTIQTKKGYLELLNNNIVVKIAPDSKIFVNINKDTITTLSGEIYISINGMYNIKMFDSDAVFYKGSYFIKVNKNSFLVISNGGKVVYKGETLEFNNKKNEVIFLKDKYSSKKVNYYNKKLVEFSTDLILKNISIYESYLDYFVNIILYLLDENNNYINIVSNLNNNFKDFENLQNSFMNKIKQNKEKSSLIIDEYFKLNNYLDLKILNYNSIINNFLNFYYLSQNYIKYFYILKTQLEFIKNRENIDPLWNSEIKTQFYLVWNKFKNFEENVYLFKSAVNGNLENIFKNDSKLVYYLNFYNKKKNELSNVYFDYIDSLNVKENKEIFKNLIRIFLKFSHENIIINSSINKVFIQNDYLINFKKLLENNYLPELSIDEMFYRISLGYNLIEEKKTIQIVETQIDKYFKMFNYLLINKSIELTNVHIIKGDIISKIKNLYKALKLNLLTYYKLIDEYNYNIHNFKAFLNSRLKRNQLSTYQYEFNTSFSRYLSYITDINKRISNTKNENIILIEKYYEIQNFLFKLIDVKYNFYLNRFKNFLFLQKEQFNRKFNQNKANLYEIKNKFKKLNNQVRVQSFVEKLSIALIAVQEIKNSIEKFLSYYSEIDSFYYLKIMGYSIIKGTSNNTVKSIMYNMDLLESFLNELVKNMILYKKSLLSLNQTYSLIYLQYQTDKNIEITNYDKKINIDQNNLLANYKSIIEVNYKIDLILQDIENYMYNLNSSTTGMLKFKNSILNFINNFSLDIKRLRPSLSINDLIIVKY